MISIIVEPTAPVAPTTARTVIVDSSRCSRRDSP
jgi:hypothetical protein